MKLELTIYGSLCSTQIFSVNGVDADSGDFGDQEDQGSDDAEDYCCGNMVFERKPSTPETLEKYSISEEDYQHIAEKLEGKLSWGECGWCS
jgi:hypothetical protein